MSDKNAAKPEKPEKKPFHVQVAEKLIEQMRQGIAPWQKPWAPGETGDALPYNAKTGNRYKGINIIQLMSQGHDDPRWMTYNQAADTGAQVRKGERGTMIQHWQFTEQQRKVDENGKPVLDADGKPIKVEVSLERPRVHYAVVFNASQIDGLPPLPPKAEIAEWARIEQAENVLKASGVPIKHDQGDRAYYSPRLDEIHLPDRAQFPSADNYYAVALHELGHATGHESRLGRDLSNPFGSAGYAREELRAEIASMLTGATLGTGHDPSRHAAYVASWIKSLEDDPLEIFRASADAEKIHGYVMSLAATQVIEPEAHELTKAEFMAQAEVHELQDHARKWNVVLPGRYTAFSDAATAVEAVADAHRGAVNNALYAFTAEAPDFLKEQTARGTLRLPSAQVLADYPDLYDKFPDVFQPDSTPPMPEGNRLVGATPNIGGSMASNVLMEHIEDVLGEPQHRYEFHDPFLETTTRFLTAAAATARADELGIGRFQHREADGTVKQVDKVDGEWWVRNEPTAPQNSQQPPAPEDKPLASIQEAIDRDSLRAIEARAEQRAEVAQGFDAAADKQLALADAHAFRRIETSTWQESAAVVMASNARVYPEYKAGLDNAIPGYPGTAAKVYALDATNDKKIVAKEERKARDLATARTRLDVPYAARDQAKRAAGKLADGSNALEWDKTEKKWYAKPGADLDKLKQWLPDPTRPQQTSPVRDDEAVRREFAKALTNMGGVVAGDHPIMDGEKHRLAETDDKGADTSITYFGHLDGHPAGYIKNHRTGHETNWKATESVATAEHTTPEQRAALTEQTRAKLLARDQAQAAKHAAAAKTILALLAMAPPADAEHAYLVAKQVRAGDLRQVPDANTPGLPEGVLIGATWRDSKQLREANPDKLVMTAGDLLVAAQDIEGNIQSVQVINERGSKVFAKGAKKEAGFHVVGGAGLVSAADLGGAGLAALDAAPAIVIGEGYATADTASTALGYAVVSAFDSGNLMAVTVAMRDRYPDKPIVIAGDNDVTQVWTDGRNPGKDKALEAAAAVNGRAIFPVFASSEQQWPTHLAPVTPEMVKAGQLTDDQVKAIEHIKRFSDFNDLATKSSLRTDPDVLHRQLTSPVHGALGAAEATQAAREQLAREQTEARAKNRETFVTVATSLWPDIKESDNPRALMYQHLGKLTPDDFAPLVARLTSIHPHVEGFSLKDAQLAIDSMPPDDFKSMVHRGAEKPQPARRAAKIG